MKNRLFIVEGLPGSGKSTISSFVAKVLEENEKVYFVDEGTGNHPADYEFHALAPAGLISEQEEIVALSQYSDELFDKLLQYKIYDFLPWDKEMPIMLDKWREFVGTSKQDMVYVFNCVLLQNPMCETMMRFGFAKEESYHYIEKIVDIVKPLNPVVIYLKNTDISNSVENVSKERPGWLESVIEYHVNGKYGKSIGAEGFCGYIQCLEERQKREIEILEKLSLKKLVVENPQKDWDKAKEKIKSFVKSL